MFLPNGKEKKSTSILKDRKSTRLNSSHVRISYAVFCLKKKTHHLIFCCSLPRIRTTKHHKSTTQCYKSLTQFSHHNHTSCTVSITHKKSANANILSPF